MSRVKTSAQARGFTLIEVLIVMAIIGAMMALGVTAMFPGEGTKMRQESARLAGIIKFLYNEAAVKNRYFRIVFDLENQTYSIESNDQPFLVSMVDEDNKKGGTREPEPSASPGASFQQEEGFLFKDTKLPEGIKFKDIFVMHMKDKQEHGKVAVYFFPNGFVEPFVINLSDSDEQNFYSLQINPLTGKANIRSEYYDAKPEELQTQPQEGRP